MTKQSILTVSTVRNSLRDEIVGWTLEQSKNVDTEQAQEYLVKYPGSGGWKHIGLSGGIAGYRDVHFDCVLRALAYGWKLMAPPTEYKEGKTTMYEWWLTKDE